jgi:hypothetical protein
MPRWLFFIWVALIAWSGYYLIRYAWPDLKDWSSRPLPTEAERPQ